MHVTGLLFQVCSKHINSTYFERGTAFSLYRRIHFVNLFFFQRRLNLSAAVFECFEVGSAQELRAIWRYIKSQHVKRNTPSTAYAKGGPWYVTVHRKVEPAFAIGNSVPKYDKYTCRLVATTSLIFSTSRKGYFTKASPHMEQSSLEALAPSKGNKPTSSYHPA